ncbi:hypothetical protein CHCC20441_1390 [Bacillus licheniformis]|nr:hypothetical protein CHCC5025_3930 [Bacillus licheniformis]TWN11201.1 hypothetical protein CHCC14564_3753 [Bacillus licheniformis LMG 17339]TWJ43303.1 hypothetical protein CHCC5026_1943 [Bacillus licheniformis]TWJ90617.1 hypothetical protein CHCC20495_2626 [Bacillus licheniformis]TWJ95512.1 hypothetical protein CHCC20493_2866 [Bacillus licheniformis]
MYVHQIDPPNRFQFSFHFTKLTSLMPNALFKYSLRKIASAAMKHCLLHFKKEYSPAKRG